MDSLNYLDLKNKVKDKTKGQKIAAALYLVSGHLSDTDPLKNALRTHAVTISTSVNDGHVTSAARAIETLLGTAVMAGLISEKNVSVICLELRHYVIQGGVESDTVSELFTPVLNDTFSKNAFTGMSYSTTRAPLSSSVSPVVKSSLTNDNKSKRQDRILAFINEKKSVGIKDIAALFSDTSEKTIQRELSVLVNAGKITKRGEKRWSVYLKV